MLSKAKSIFTTIGGCASKPKVLEGGLKTGEAPEEAVENVAEEPNTAATTASEEGEKREVVITSGIGGDVSGSEQITKTEGQAAVADDENGGVKARSLGNLFLENEEEKESNNSEAVIKEPTSSEVKPTEQVDETEPPKAEAHLVSEPVLEANAAAAVDNKLPEEIKLAPKEPETALTPEKKSEEVKLDLIAANGQEKSEKKAEEIVKPVADEVKQSIPVAENVEKSETTDEKKSKNVIKSGEDEQNADQQSAKTSEDVKQVVASEKVEILKTSEEVKEQAVEAVIAEKKIETVEEKKEEDKPAIVKTENQA